MAYCKNCGADLPESGSFCTSCGAKIEAEAPVESAAVPVQPEPEKPAAAVYTAPVYNASVVNERPAPVKSGKATASLVLGIIGLLVPCLCCCFTKFAAIVGIILSVLAIVLAVSSKKDTNGKMLGSAKAGLVLGIIALVLALILFLISCITIPSLDLNDPESVDKFVNWVEDKAGKEAGDSVRKAIEDAKK